MQLPGRNTSEKLAPENEENPNLAKPRESQVWSESSHTESSLSPKGFHIESLSPRSKISSRDETEIPGSQEVFEPFEGVGDWC